MSSTITPEAEVTAEQADKLGDIDPRFVERRAEVRREEGRNRRRIMIGVGCALAAALLGYGSLYSPLFSVRHVIVSGNGAIPRAQVIAAAGLAHPGALISVDGVRDATRLDRVPLLGLAKVTRSWPDTVRIRVVVRSPVAVVPIPSTTGKAGQPAGWATVDATGRVLADLPSAPPGLPLLFGAGVPPVVGGWFGGSAGSAANPHPGARITDMNAAPDSATLPSGMSAALAVAASIPRDLRSDVQSITVGPPLTMSVLPARIASGTIPVTLGGGSRLAEKLSALEALLTQAELSGAWGIDLSVPDHPGVLTVRH